MSTTKKPSRLARAPQLADSNDLTSDNPAAAEPSPSGPARVTKQGLVLDLLRQEDGASLSAIVAATGWLPHTARAALTGLRKKGHSIERSKIDGETRYAVKASASQ